MRLGAYEVQDEIGRGGTGVVLRARAPSGRIVAIKVLRRFDSQEHRARFERERRLLLSLGADEGFVPLLDAGDASSSSGSSWRGLAAGPYLVMPFLPGGTLRARLGRKQLPMEEALSLVAALADAVGHAHSRRIIHRDLKPENVLFTEDGRPLIADLGLAKHFRSDALGLGRSVSLTQAGDFHGTAGYMAPEQMLNAREATPAADVFSLGAILYECLAGEPAFQGETVVELLAKVELGSYEPLRSRRPEAPAWVERAIERALARDPRARFEDAGAFARALREGAPRRARWASAALGAVLLLAAGVGLGALIFGPSSNAAPTGTAPLPPPATTTTKPAPPRVDPVKALLDKGAALLAKTDNDGAIAAFTKALELDPKCSQAFAGRGDARVRKWGEWDKAIEDLTRAIELDPRNSSAWFNRGTARQAKGDHASAVADLTRSIELDPKHAMSWKNRGASWFSLRQLQRAISDYDHVLELDPRDFMSWNNRGITKD
ncbi:protein kinase, partial [bacterium]|nr:protein kinase [bacterium]